MLGVCVSGGCSIADQLLVQPGWVDRVGVSEVKQQVATLARDDAGGAGLPDVAPLREGQYRYTNNLYSCRRKNQGISVWRTMLINQLGSMENHNESHRDLVLFHNWPYSSTRYSFYMSISV